MMCGIDDKTLATMRKVFSAFPNVQSAVIFGSRVTGAYKKASDIDIAVKGDDVSLARITHELEERIPLPYHFDLIEYHDIVNTALLGHINRKGRVLYERREAIPVEGDA